MNYKAELRGFALDRATKILESNGGHTAADVFALADQITDYLYIPEKDIDAHLQTLFPLVRESGDVVKIGNIILAFEQMKAELEAGIHVN